MRFDFAVHPGLGPTPPHARPAGHWPAGLHDMTLLTTICVTSVDIVVTHSVTVNKSEKSERQPRVCECECVCVFD